MNDNHLKKLLKECDDAYYIDDYKRLIRLCDEILKTDPDCPNAIGYKSVAYCFLKNPKKAVEILEDGIERFPENYYMKNNIAMAYYDLGEYEKSLKFCEEGLEIKDFDWLEENKIKALIKLERTDDAIEFRENSKSGFSIDIVGLLIEGGKYREALDLDEDDIDVIDKIKESAFRQGLEIPDEIKEYYLSWISRIKSKRLTENCPDCGARLVPIAYGHPDEMTMQRVRAGELVLGGCQPMPENYRCMGCGHEFYLGYKGFEIECEYDRLNSYIEGKIDTLTSALKTDSKIRIISPSELKEKFRGLDDEEFEAFTERMAEIGFITHNPRGYIRIVGYNDLKVSKGYLDEGKYAAPCWLVYPELSAWTIGWRMGYGENYAMNEPTRTREIAELFPMPKYWHFNPSQSKFKPHPLLSYFWNEDGKPKYRNAGEGIRVNDFISPAQEGKFQSDTFRFNSIEHAVLLSKYLHFNKCDRNADLKTLKEGFDLTDEEEEIWKVHQYSVILNACYFRVIEDEGLKRWLLDTGNEPLLYDSDDEENLFGRALMELRDEIRRICKNEGLIDWEYTEYLKDRPW